MSPRYADKIKALENALKQALPTRRVTTKTYIGDFDYITVPADLNGASIVQYTPYQGTNGKGTDPCNRMAAVKVWAELATSPVIIKQWTPLADQQLAKRDDACE